MHSAEALQADSKLRRRASMAIRPRRPPAGEDRSSRAGKKFSTRELIASYQYSAHSTKPPLSAPRKRAIRKRALSKRAGMAFIIVFRYVRNEHIDGDISGRDPGATPPARTICPVRPNPCHPTEAPAMAKRGRTRSQCTWHTAYGVTSSLASRDTASRLGKRAAVSFR